MDTGLGKVRIRKSTIPGSTGYHVSWNAGPLTQIGAAGYCEIAEKEVALDFATEKALKLGLALVDETNC